MKEDFPLVRYERDMNHNYMVLYQCDFFGTAGDNSHDFRVRMLLENKIRGLLPITYRQMNGECRYYYEINSLQPLDRLMEKHELMYRDLRALFLGCIQLFDRLEEYLLNGEQIIIKQEFIYVNVESMEPFFVCYPDYKGDMRLCFMEFIDVLLAHIDHTDEQAVMLGYQVYRYTRNPNYVLSEIQKFMECAADTAEKSEHSKSEYANEKTGEFYIAQENHIGSLNNRVQERIETNKDSGSFMSKNPEICGNIYHEDDENIHSRKRNIRDLIGGIFCVFVALCAAAVIVGGRVLHYYPLSGDHELYMYGAVSMALMAAVLFFVCYIKMVRQNREIDALNEDCDNGVYEEIINRDIVSNLTNMSYTNYNVTDYAVPNGGVSACSNETVCLGSEAMEERVLRGRVNGEEVIIQLDCLPLTVGKLGGVSDFIINDNAVSKMHARFEEHKGKVCVCDLNSTNGTVRNGETIAIHTPVVLEQGDTLRFGRSCFTYY